MNASTRSESTSLARTIIRLGLISGFLLHSGVAAGQRGGPATQPKGSGGEPAAVEKKNPFATLSTGFEWGMNPEQVMGVYEKRIWTQFDQRRSGMSDVLAIESARRRAMEEAAQMRQQYTEMKQGTEAFRVSIIENEFKLGTGESIFLVDDLEAQSQRYFFFIGQKLWKYFDAYNNFYVRNVPFQAKIEELTTLLGQPTKTRTEIRRIEKIPTEVLAEVIWQDEVHRVRLVDQTQFFGTYVLVVSGRSFEDRIGELRGEVGRVTSSAPTGDPTVKSMLSDIATPVSHKPDEDIIDKILGEKTQVDVVKEMPVVEEDFKPATAPQLLPDKPAAGSAPQPTPEPKGPIIY